MPKTPLHFAISRKRTGKGYESLHRWIDSDKKSGVNHRTTNHSYNDEQRRYVEEHFGQRGNEKEAVGEWLFHIALDNLDTSVTNDWKYQGKKRNFFMFGFEQNGYIHYEEEELSKNDMLDNFEDEEYENYDEDD